MIPLGIISAQKRTDANLLPGLSYLNLSTKGWNDTANRNKWVAGGSNFSLMNLFAEDDSLVMVKADSRRMELILFLTNADTNDNVAVGCYALNDIYFLTNNSQTDLSGVTDNDFIGLRKIGGDISVVKTIDGISFTVLHNFSTSLERSYVGIYMASGGIVNYPQGRNLTTI